jgi:hypothetical protein
LGGQYHWNLHLALQHEYVLDFCLIVLIPLNKYLKLYSFQWGVECRLRVTGGSTYGYCL